MLISTGFDGRVAFLDAATGEILGTVRPGPENLFARARYRDAETIAVLDTIATSLAAESARQVGKRVDGARAAIVGEKQTPGRITYASIDPAPLDRERLMQAGIGFGVGYTFCLVVAVALYTRHAGNFYERLGYARVASPDLMRKRLAREEEA